MVPAVMVTGAIWEWIGHDWWQFDLITAWATWNAYWATGVVRAALRGSMADLTSAVRLTVLDKRVVTTGARRSK